ncbi:MAG: GyrI-like domain-containing protein [Coprobacillaceae bacterium]
MKIEWKKEDKEIYLPKRKPVVVNVPNYKYLTITGKGNPNDKEFSEKVSALFTLSFGIKFMDKKGIAPEGFYPFTVYPLEGIWTLAEEEIDSEILNKDALIYKVMIRQPDFVTEEVVKEILTMQEINKPNLYYNDVVLEEMEDGKCVQMMHIGSFDDEPATFAKMTQFLEDNNLEKSTHEHKEIYISNPLKTKLENMKTVLRYYIK